MAQKSARKSVDFDGQSQAVFFWPALPFWGVVRPFMKGFYAEARRGGQILLLNSQEKGAAGVALQGDLSIILAFNRLAGLGR